MTFMPGILIAFCLLFAATVTAWFHRRAAIGLFLVFMLFSLLVFLHHASDSLALHF
jgi:hypothetical protein